MKVRVRVRVIGLTRRRAPRCAYAVAPAGTSAALPPSMDTMSAPSLPGLEAAAAASAWVWVRVRVRVGVS